MPAGIAALTDLIFVRGTRVHREVTPVHFRPPPRSRTIRARRRYDEVPVGGFGSTALHIAKGEK